MTVEIRILGPLEATRDGERVDVRGTRQRTLLALLALTPGSSRPLDRIVDALWEESDPPPDPRPAVHTCVSRLRSMLGEDVVTSTGNGYQLDVSPLAVDAHRYERLVARSGDASRSLVERIEMLEEALTMWRGPALDEAAAMRWAGPDAVRLEELRAHGEEMLAEARIESGRPDDAIAALEAAAARQPLRERTHGLLMTALHAAGRRAEALRVFQAYRRRLATDLGLEPGRAIVELDREIAHADDTTASPPARRELPAARGYRLLERIGEGAFAVVYRGVQPAVDREVAVKVIREELANRPQFIRRFEAEAHLVARLEHPHIVPLYDYWREPDSAWLVMRLFRGGTLEDRLGAERLGVDEVARMVVQVGGALAASHQAGVVHRDVKPANVFLDDDGNAFLGDFGIAYAEAVPHLALDSLSVGSPAYAAPEQLRREPVGPGADIHGLAIAVFECLTGRLPFGDAPNEAELLRRQLNDPLPLVRSVRHDVSDAVDEVLQRATAKRPTDRYATVGSFVEAFTAAVTGSTPKAVRRGASTAIGSVERNPYKGLLPFQEADASDFFGRARMVARVLEQMRRLDASARLVALVGPSGGGKSSVVRAGLLPALRGGALAGSERWFITTMVPGVDPFEELEAALARVAGSAVGGLAEMMASDRRGIGRAVKQTLPDESAELVLVIDQFEELFTLCPDAAIRQRFAAGLAAAVTDPKSRLRVVTTLRADFYDQPLRLPEFASVVEQGTVVVVPLAPDELEEAITDPATRAGAEFEPGLVARIVADVVDQPGALPLLQYALTELFERRVSGVLTLDAYDALGGISGALGQRAEAIHEAMPVEHQMLTRRIFTRLSTLGDGTGDTRRRVRRSELGRDPAIDTVLATFGTARLLAFDHDPMTREPTIEVAHEAMLREWRRLREWLDDDRDGRRVHRHLTDAATAWNAASRDPGELYRGGRLETAGAWAAEHADDLNDQERAFVDASVEAERVAVEAEHRSTRRLHRLLVAVAIVAVVALVASVLALGARRRAERNESAAAAAAAEAEQQRAAADEQRVAADEAAARAVSARDEAEQTAFDAETARIAASVPTIATSDASLAMLLAAESYQREQSAATLGALHDALRGAGDVLRFVPSKVLGLASEFFFADDRIVAASLPDKVLVLDPTTLEVIEEFTMDDPAPFVVGLSGSFLDVHDGHAVWVGMQHAWVLDLETGASRPLPGGPPSGAKFDSTSGRLALVDDTGALSLFESATSDLPSWTVAGDGRRTVGEMAASEPFVRALGDARLLSSLAFDPSGSSVWIARGLGPQRHDIVDGRVITTVELSTAGSALGQRLTTFGDDVLAVNDSSTLNFIDVTTGGARPVLSVVPPDVIIDVIDVGAAMLVAFYSGRYSLIRRDGAIVRDRVPNHVGQGGGYGLTPDGRLLVSGAKGFVELALDGGTLLRDAVPGSEVADFFFVSGDGRHAISDFGPSTAASARVLWECGVSGRQCRLSDQVRVVDGSAVPFSLFAEPDFRIRADVGTDVVTLVDPAGTEIGRVPTPVGAPVGNLFVPPSREWVAVSGYFSGVLDVYSLPRGS